MRIIFKGCGFFHMSLVLCVVYISKKVGPEDKGPECSHDERRL